MASDTFTHAFASLAQTSDQVITGQGAASAPAGTSTTGAPGTPPPAGTGGGQPGGGGMGMLLLPLLAFFVIMILMQGMAGRKQRKKREELLRGIKKYDKVLTIGGIIGTVAEVRDDEVVLRVDDSGNTKIRFQRAAIQTVIADGPAESTSGGASPGLEVKTRSPEKVTV